LEQELTEKTETARLSHPQFTLLSPVQEIPLGYVAESPKISAAKIGTGGNRENGDSASSAAVVQAASLHRQLQAGSLCCDSQATTYFCGFIRSLVAFRQCQSFWSDFDDWANSFVGSVSGRAIRSTLGTIRLNRRARN